MCLCTHCNWVGYVLRQWSRHFYQSFCLFCNFNLRPLDWLSSLITTWKKLRTEGALYKYPEWMNEWMDWPLPRVVVWASWSWWRTCWPGHSVQPPIDGHPLPASSAPAPNAATSGSRPKDRGHAFAPPPTLPPRRAAVNHTRKTIKDDSTAGAKWLDSIYCNTTSLPMTVGT